MERAVMFFAVVVFVSAAVFAQAPERADQVPGYPGAKLVSEQQSPTREEIASGKAPTWVFALERVTSSTASVEQVVQFYATKLGAVLEQEGGADPNDLAPGQLSSVGSSVEYWDQGLVDDGSDAVKAAFEKRARLPGVYAWASGAAFSWAYKNAEKDPYSFTLTITDKSVTDENPSAYLQRTEISLSVRMMNQEKMAAAQAEMRKSAQGSSTTSPQQYQADQQAWGEEMQKRQRAADAEIARQNAEADKVRAELSTPPTEKQLGVAIYPGARYDVDLSVEKSLPLSDGARVYIFEAPAKPDAVAQFYVKRTGNAVGVAAGNAFFIPINFGKPAQKGDTPPVKDSMIISGPTETGTSVIMILKMPAGWTGQEGAGR